MTRRIIIEETDELIGFHLPRYREESAFLLFPLLLFSWLGGLLAIGYPLITGELVVNVNAPFLDWMRFVAWLLAWSFGGFFFVRLFAKNILGQDVLIFTKSELTIKHKVLWTRDRAMYHEEEIVSLEVIGDQTHSVRDYLVYFGFGSEKLLLTHSLGQMRLGAGLTEQSAAEILEMIFDKFPQYKPRDPATRHRWTPPRAS